MRAITQLQSQGMATAIGEAAYKSFWAAPPSLEAHAGKLVEIYSAALKRGG